MIDDVLGFNPKQKEYEVKMIEITPTMASHILNNYNNDNRKLKKQQSNKIAQSILKDGWLQDGGALTFNVEGNITEFQHRLDSIVQTGVTVTAPVVLGVATECFTKTAPPKARRPVDEIQRKDKNALDSDVAVLREILSRRGGETLNMQNAVASWNKWKKTVKAGQKIVDGFFDRVTEYSSYRRNFTAWASLLHHVGRQDVAETFLELLEAEVLDEGSSYTLTKDFINFFMKHSWAMPNAGRSEFMYQLLCICADRTSKNPTGAIQLDKTIDKMNHTSLKQRGFYRLFLEDPDDIKATEL